MNEESRYEVVLNTHFQLLACHENVEIMFFAIKTFCSE